MTKEQEFFLYLLELYATKKDSSSGKILQEWDALGLTDLICDMYERYHSEAIENSFDDIDQLVIERKLQMERIGKEEHYGRIGENTKGEGKL